MHLYPHTFITRWRRSYAASSTMPPEIYTSGYVTVVSSPYEYCSRCDTEFATLCKYKMHVHSSAKHHECPECDFDSLTWVQLLQHCRLSGCRVVCQGCGGGAGQHWSHKGYLQHLQDNHVCTDCELHFASAANLFHVRH